jgi:type I restriction enzyme S subunit
VVLLADAIKNRSGNSKLIKGKLHEEPAAGRFQGFSASGADVWCDDYEHEGQAIIISAVGARCGKAFKASGKWCAIANTNITRPEPSLLDFDFAYLVLNNEHFWVRGGSAQPFVKFPPSLDRHFALPPLAEQKRIVAKVDELMALCDRLEAQQQERETRHAALARASLARFADAPTPANLPFLFHPSYAIPPADLRKSILTLAVQGKLVPQDPNDEPAEELLERVKAAREVLVVERRVRQSDEVEYSLQDEEDDAPTGWVGVHVNDVAIVQGGKRLPNGAVFSESPTPHVYIRVTDMKNGTISETGLRYISPEVQREIARYIINKEDLYITIAGTIGDVGCVPEALDGHNLTENAAKIVFRGFDRRFFQLALTSEFVQAQFLEKTKQMAQPKLALKRIAGAKFYLPPLAEQRRIVAKVDQLMTLVDALETQLAASRATAANLLSALVAELTVAR